MLASTFDVVAGLCIFCAIVFVVYLFKSIEPSNTPGSTFISEAEKKTRIQNSVRAMLSSSDLNDIDHAQMLIEGMCKDDPIWMLQVLGDFRRSTPSWMSGIPHRERILVWARSKLKS